jgi:DNA-binding GntR family transcriptional regulator
MEGRFVHVHRSVARRSEVTFPPEQPAPMGANYQRVRDVLRHDILSGIFEPGDRLKINALVERYDVGANPIREALQQLQGEGLVEMTPNKGATVRYLDDEVTRQMLELRQAIDAFVARKFAEIGSYQLLDELKRVQARFEAAVAAGREAEYPAFNNAFHEIIIAAANNREAEAFLARSSMLTRTIRGLVGYGGSRIDAILAEHRALIDAFERRDAGKASEIARLHAKHASDDLLAQYHKMMAARSSGERAAGGRRARIPKGWSPELANKRF